MKTGFQTVRFPLVAVLFFMASNAFADRYILAVTDKGSARDWIYTISSNATDARPNWEFPSITDSFRDLVSVGETGAALAVLQGYGTDQLLRLDFKANTYGTVHKSRWNERLSAPAVSPDDRFVVFISQMLRPRTLGAIQLYDFENDTIVEPKSLSSRASHLQPQFAPSGNTLTFLRRTGGGDKLMAAQLDATGERVVVSDPKTVVASGPKTRLSDLLFSPDGTSCLFLRQTGKGSQLILRSPCRSDGADKEISPKLDVAYEPSWSPDGTKILYWSETMDGQFISVYDLISGKIRHVAPIAFLHREDFYGNRLRPDVCPVWAPNMKEVYFASAYSERQLIYKYNFQSDRVTLLMNGMTFYQFSCPRVIGDYEGE